MSAINVSAPTIFGATVKRLVLTVEYPRLPTICGKKLLTLVRGTPNVKLTTAQTLQGSSKNAKRILGSTVIPIHRTLKGSKTVTDTQLFVNRHRRICKNPHSCDLLSRGLRNHHVEGERGSQKKAKTANITVDAPEGNTERDQIKLYIALLE